MDVLAAQLNEGMDPIEPLPTAVVAFVGACEDGPVGEPVTVTSADDYHAQFGSSLDPERPLGHAVDLFFANAGDEATSVLVVRTDGPDVVDGVRALDGTGYTVLVLPGVTTQHNDAVRSALERCSAYAAVLLLDLPNGPWISAQHDLDAITAHRERVAVYHPWVVVDGVNLPPGGAVAGVIARTDRERGVWRAAGGTSAQLHGIAGLAETVDQQVGDAMTVAGVNGLRDFGRQGHLVWGVRTLASTTTRVPEERYLPPRRLVDHVRRSVEAGLAGVVFEDDNPGLWAQVRLVVDEFLGGLWRAGALQGTKPEEAYFVQCGLGQTMTEQDVADGKVIVRWGLSVSRPAEFAVSTVTVASAVISRELLAHPLGPVVSRYIGETEKNLARSLEQSGRVARVLFFDEADAIFGRRTEIADSHDRYANLEVGSGSTDDEGDASVDDEGDDVDDGQRDRRDKRGRPARPPRQRRQTDADQQHRGRPPGQSVARGEDDDH